MATQKRAEKTRLKILEAAEAEFSLKGFHGARVDEIARRAGANKERLYAYFGGKENLFRRVLRDNLEKSAEDEEEFALHLCDGADFAEVLLTRYIEFNSAHPRFWRLLAWENLGQGNRAKTLKGVKKRSYEQLRRFYLEGQKKGRFKKSVSFETFIFVLTAIAFFQHSNQKTMSETLGLDLGSPAVREDSKERFSI